MNLLAESPSSIAYREKLIDEKNNPPSFSFKVKVYRSPMPMYSIDEIVEAQPMTVPNASIIWEASIVDTPASSLIVHDDGPEPEVS